MGQVGDDRANMIPHLKIIDRLRIYGRFTRYILWEFRWALGVFPLLVLGGGALLHAFYLKETLSLARACHAVFLMIFLESSLDFPEEWYLQPLFFLLPILGLGAVADSVIRLAYLVFSRKRNLPEWNRMLASLCRNHVIVVGVDRVGYQVIRELLGLRETIVAIESHAEAPLLFELYDRSIPVITGNARMPKVLKQAGVSKAKAVIVTTGDDLTNLDVGLTARELSPKARIVLRLFDDTLAAKVPGSFAMSTISTSQVAAPAFIAEALGHKVYQCFQLSGEKVHLTDLKISPGGRLAGLSVGQVQADKLINIVMHQGQCDVNLNPDARIILQAGDTILVIAPMSALLNLEGLNDPSGSGRVNLAGRPD